MTPWGWAALALLLLAWWLLPRIPEPWRSYLADEEPPAEGGGAQ